MDMDFTAERTVHRRIIKDALPADILSVLSIEKIEQLIDSVEELMSQQYMWHVLSQLVPSDKSLTAQGIRAARKEVGLTQAELAEKLGVGLRTVEAWETGKRQPRYKHGNLLERILSFKKSE